MKTLSHTRDVIDLFGGNHAFETKFEARQTTVSEWRNIDRFPHWLRFPLMTELRLKGYTVTESLFGLTQAAIAKRKQRSRKGKPSTGGGRGKGGKNGTGKGKARQRATGVVGRVHQHA